MQAHDAIKSGPWVMLMGQLWQRGYMKNYSKATRSIWIRTLFHARSMQLLRSFARKGSIQAAGRPTYISGFEYHQAHISLHTVSNVTWSGQIHIKLSLAKVNLDGSGGLRRRHLYVPFSQSENRQSYRIRPFGMKPRIVSIEMCYRDAGPSWLSSFLSRSRDS